MPLQSPERIDGKGHNDNKDPHSCRVSRVRTYVYLCPLHVTTIRHRTARHRHTAACRSAGGKRPSWRAPRDDKNGRNLGMQKYYGKE